jgi:thioredoxin reductase (NADPH)
MTSDGSSRPVDVTILGAGPAGLAAAYYAGHRNASARLIDSYEQIGGQVTATYPEKEIYDVAGHPRIKGRELVELCTEQGLQFGAEVRLGEEVEGLRRISDGAEELLEITTKQGGRYTSRTLIVTSGQEALEPRKLPIEGLERWEGVGLHYFVGQKDAFAGARCVIVGGGDSALDWTLELADTAARPLRLVHRREAFRGREASVRRVRELERAGRVHVLTPYEVREIHGDGRVEAVSIENTAAGTIERVDCDALILLLGYDSHLGAVAQWGLALIGPKQIKIDPRTCETSMPLVYAAGDAAGYEGKIRLITVGMAEAAIAVNNAIAKIRGETAQPKYSTE